MGAWLEDESLRSSARRARARGRHVSRFWACSFGAVALTHSIAHYVAPEHPLPLGIELAIALSVSLWVAWETPQALRRAIRRRFGPHVPPVIR